MPSFLPDLIRRLSAAAPDAFVVGGAVRDRLLGRESPDLDLAVGGDPIAIGDGVAASLGATLVVLDAERGHVRLQMHSARDAGPKWVDLTGHGGDLDAELRRRDFSVNAMAAPLASWGETASIRRTLVDPLGGVKDLERRVLRATGPWALTDDPLRMARAVRLSIELGFEIDAATRGWIVERAASLAGVPGERIRDEFFRLLAAVGAARGVELLDEFGLLKAVIPELEAGRGVSQPVEHSYDVLDHSIRTVEAGEAVLGAASTPAPPAGAGELAEVPCRSELSGYFKGVVAEGQTRSTLLKLAGLLHDVAKPETRTEEAGGRVRFIGHHERGAEVTRAVLRRLRCGRATVLHVATMVRYHLRPAQMSQGRVAPSRRALFRYYRDVGDVAIDTLYLNLADYLAARGPQLEVADWRAYTKMIGAILSAGFDTQSASEPVLLLSGHEVMGELGLEPGPKIGELLRALREAEADGRVQSREEALELLRRAP